jgi:hypothetical protein
MTRSGIAYQLRPSVPGIYVTDSGWWPTPTATDYGTNVGGAAGRTGKVRPNLSTMARHGLWPTLRAQRGAYTRDKGDPDQPRLTVEGLLKLMPTPQARDYKGKSQRAAYGDEGCLPNVIGGAPNPRWLEWFMGFPIGWCQPEPSETRASRRSSR